MSTSETDESPFHPGELAVQDRSGVLDEADYLGRRMFRPFLTEQHREFFEQLPFIMIGSVDDTGQPWASMLIGKPGFVHSPDPLVLEVDAAVSASDPLNHALRPDAAVGVLGIQLQTRRRNRMNGRVLERNENGFSIQVDQSFGNCPKYISARSPTLDASLSLPAAEPARPESHVLSTAAVACIASADTCFIASASAATFAADNSREGVDVSHRGGKPGFVRVQQTDSGTKLYMPDFAGNNAFNTLGNLARYPRAGLLFPNFDTGDVLLLACSTELHWDGPELARFAGAQRMIVFSVRRGLTLSRHMPFRWTAPVPGPHVERTGTW